MDALRQDIRFGLRLFLRAPGVFAIAVLALALGIGANTAVFSVVYNVLLKPLPFPEPDRLVAIYDTQPALKTAPASYPEYVDWRDQNRVFEAVGGASSVPAVLTGAGEPERIRATRATASLFRVFQVQPLAGRWFTEDEDKPGGPRVMMLAYGFWQKRFAGDGSIVGRTMTLDDVPRTVVGIMPASFTLTRADAFVPLAMALDQRARGSHFLPTFGRLKPGVTAARAQAEMVALGRRLAREHGNNSGIDVRAYSEVVIADSRRPLIMLLASVSLVLLIACANVANLLLVRSTGRRKEIALRAAIGAGGSRLARQMLTESVMLALAGGAAGLLLAWAGVRAFAALAPPVLPRMTTLGVDATVLLFTLGCALITGVAFGLAPMLYARRATVADALQEESGRATGGRASRRATNAIVVLEIAVSLVLLVGAGLLAKSLAHLEQQDIGVVVERVLTFDVALPNARYDDAQKIRGFYRLALDRIRSIPGVSSVGATSGLPLYNFGNNSYFTIEGKSLWKPGEEPLAEARVVTGDYFKALGVPLISGRFFDERDNADSKKVAIINRAMAERFWPNENPVGKRIMQWFGRAPVEIVGVVGSVRSYNPAVAPALEVSYSLGQTTRPAMTVVLRTTGEPTSLVTTLRREIAAVDPAQPLANVQTMEEVVRTSLARPRLFSVLTSAFAALAALLALIGVYGLIAYTVTQQRREFGIRMALGADAPSVRRLVLARALKLAVAGIITGVVSAYLSSRLLESMLFNVAPTDPLVFGAACAAMLVAATFACLVPAYAASRADPASTLRG